MDRLAGEDGERSNLCVEAIESMLATIQRRPIRRSTEFSWLGYSKGVRMESVLRREIIEISKMGRLPIEEESPVKSPKHKFQN